MKIHANASCYQNIAPFICLQLFWPNFSFGPCTMVHSPWNQKIELAQKIHTSRG